VGVVSNQSGIGRGAITAAQVDRVNARVDERLGPFDTWRYCGHAPADACACRMPAPGLVLRAAADLGVLAHEVAVIGDIGTDIRAAQAAGAVGILVPSARTLRAEVRDTPGRVEPRRRGRDRPRPAPSRGAGALIPAAQGAARVRSVVSQR
jgi:histidinol phosphatase-like enzyme